MTLVSAVGCVQGLAGASPADLANLKERLVKTAEVDLQYASTFVEENGQILFGNSTRAMRGGGIDSQFTPKHVRDEFWIHPDSGIKLVSSPRRPVKAWHSGFISSLARASNYVSEEDREDFVETAKDVARFFMNAFLTPKEYAYGVNRMWTMGGQLVTWEDLRDGKVSPWQATGAKGKKKAKPIPGFELKGIPWFIADRFGVVYAPWIARAGWGDLDFLVEVFVTLYEITNESTFRKVAEDLASPFWKYREMGDSKRDFSFLVRTDPGQRPLYSHESEKAHHYFWAHDAEGAVYAYFRLASTFPADSVEHKKYRDLGIRMADLWLEIMNVDPFDTAKPTGSTPPPKVKSREKKRDFPGWPPMWRYRLDKFLPGTPPKIEITPLYWSWEKDSIEESRSQVLGSDFFRIDHVPQGLMLAYFETGKRAYLSAADHIAQWMWNQENMDRRRATLKRVSDPKGRMSAHNVHSDSPYMRASLVLTHALLAKGFWNTKDKRASRKYRERAIRGLKKLLDDRVKINGSDKSFPLYSLDGLTFMANGKRLPVHLSNRVWEDPTYEAAPLHNELYGYVYDYLFMAMDILQTL